MSIAAKTFEIQDQLRFAQLSGDANPMHLDPVAARRTAAGAPVVHGVHALLWMLDAVGLARPEIGRIAKLKVRFRKMIYLGERVEVHIVRHAPPALHLQARVDGADLIEVWARLGEPGAAGASAPPGETVPPRLTEPLDPGDQQIEGLAGLAGFAASPQDMRHAFPGAARLFGERRIAALACATYLVGMVVPGLRSLFVAIDVAAVDGPAGVDALRYAVASVDTRFRRADIEIAGGGIEGTIGAIIRPAPVAQAGMQAAAAAVDAGEFAGSTALVIGGSRGLGEITAKLLAAGGARVCITYAAGGADAERLAAEIRAAGGHCRTLRYDVLEDARPQLLALSADPPAQIYYFAAPTIHQRKAGVFSAQRFEDLNRYFVHGFFAALEAVLELRPAGVSAFYPSSEFVVHRPAEMTEYAMSKAAAEALCEDIAAYSPGARVLVRRLPRLLTDQTAMLAPGEAADPLPVMLPVIRAMQG